MRGQEVSNRFVLGLIATCRRRGIAEGRLLEDLSFAVRLEDPSGRLPWDEFTVFLDRVEAAAGGPAAMEELAAETIEARPVLRMMASLLLDPRLLYLQLIPWMAARMHSMVSVAVEPLPGGRIRIATTIPAPYRPSRPYLRGALAFARVAPRLLGLPDARAEAELTERRSVVVVSPPPSRTLTARALRRVRARAVAECDLVSAEAAELGILFEAPAAAGPPPPAPRAAPDEAPVASGGLAREDGPPELADARGGDSRAEPGALAPRIAVAEAAAAGGAAAQDGAARAERLARVAAAWRLTPRQREVLGLLVAGQANKEIAATLRCTCKMVESHVTRILRQAGVPSRAALITRFWES